MRIDRRFTTAGNPYPGIDFVTRTATLHGVVKELVAPADWSQNAVDILAGKYFRRAGVPAAWYFVEEPGVPDFLRRALPTSECPAFVAEHDARQVFRRLAGCWAYWAYRLNYFGLPIDPTDPADAGRQNPVEAARAYMEEMMYMLAAQLFAPASPQWFNTGLHWAYGIEGPDSGQYAISVDGLYPDGKRSGCPVHLFQDGDPRPGVRKHHEPFTRWEERRPPCEGNGLVQAVARAYTRPAAHACFILGVDDNLVQERGITDTLTREARVFKFGGGAGANFSRLRGEGEKLSGGGYSSGLLSWLRLLDCGAGAIKSAGTTRRAAKMDIVDIDHPDIEQFVRWKVEEEWNVAALYAGSRVLNRVAPMHRDQAARKFARQKDRAGKLFAGEGMTVENLIVDEFGHAAADHLDFVCTVGTDGMNDIPPQMVPRLKLAGKYGVKYQGRDRPYTTDFVGADSAYPFVSGQNANNSVRIPNKFFDVLDAGGEWELLNRTDGSVKRRVKAADLWRLIVECAWGSADPGTLHDDLINDWNTCVADGRIRACNPCAEYHFLDDTACNLGSHRLVKFAVMGPRGEVVGFKLDDYRHAVRLAMVALDTTVSMAAYPSKDVAEGSRKYRTTGLGYADLGAFLMRAGVGYDSDAGRAWCAAITSLMHSEAYRTSAEIAAAVGPFPRFDANREHALRVVKNHAAFAFRFAGHRDHPTTQYAGLSVKPPEFDGFKVPSAVREAVDSWASDMVQAANAHGLRNAQVTVLAPTGTIGLLLDCDTTGIEPDFALVKTKKLVGGGYMKIVNQSLPAALAALGYSDADSVAVRDHVFGTRRLPRLVADGEFRHVPGWCAQVGLLLNLGLTEAEIARVEAELPAADSIDDALKIAVDAERWAALTGNRVEDMQHPDYSPLLALLTTPGGMAAASWGGDDSDDDDDDAMRGVILRGIEEADRLVCGAGSVEGAPHLTADHVAVFDCATPVGDGVRALSPDSHVWMMAAAQPSLSGAISKTINMPADASPDDVDRVYRLSHRLMIKAVALYPDGCKLSQPLAGSKTRRRWAPAAGPRQPADPRESFPATGGVFGPFTADDVPAPPAPPPAKAAPVFPSPAAPKRHPLPTRRPGVTQHFTIGGQPFYLRTGEYPDGTLGEIFLTAAVEGSTFQSLANAFAIAVSVGLQHGIPIEAYAEKWQSMKFEPNGIVQGHDRIKMASSFLAAIGRDLLINYRGRDELADVQPDPHPDAPADQRPVARVVPDQADPNRVTFDPPVNVVSGQGVEVRGGFVYLTAAPPGEVRATFDTGEVAPPESPRISHGFRPVTAAQRVAPPAGMGGRFPGAPDPNAAAAATAKRNGYTGRMCAACGSFRLKRTGQCYMCEDCKTDSGCG